MGFALACTLPAQFVGPHRPNVGTRLDIQGRAGVALPVPNSSSLAGVSVFMQWVENTPTGALSTAVGFKVVK